MNRWTATLYRPGRPVMRTNWQNAKLPAETLPRTRGGTMVHHHRSRHGPLRAVRALSRRAHITIGASTAVLGLAALGLMAAPASATTATTGGWVLNPAQSVSTSTSTTTGSAYQAQVQQPINAD